MHVKSTGSNNSVFGQQGLPQDALRTPQQSQNVPNERTTMPAHFNRPGGTQRRMQYLLKVISEQPQQPRNRSLAVGASEQRNQSASGVIREIEDVGAMARSHGNEMAHVKALSKVTQDMAISEHTQMKDFEEKLKQHAQIDPKVRNQLRDELSGLEEQIKNRVKLVVDMMQSHETAFKGIHKSRLAKIGEAYEYQNKQLKELAKVKEGLDQGASMEKVRSHMWESRFAQQLAAHKFERALKDDTGNGLAKKLPGPGPVLKGALMAIKFAGDLIGASGPARLG